MPLLQKWSINNHAIAAIWKIDEPESFFSQATGLNVSIGHEKKRMEHLCGRFLLQYIYPNFPIHQIAPDNNDKPRLPNNTLYFSISHSWPYVAVIIDEVHEAGIDIQTINHRIPSIKHKFLSPAEQLLFGDDIHLLTLAWSAKEAAYKWNGRRGVPFIEELPILFHQLNENEHLLNIHIGNLRHIMLHITAALNSNFVCAFVTGHEEWINE